MSRTLRKDLPATTVHTEAHQSQLEDFPRKVKKLGTHVAWLDECRCFFNSGLGEFHSPHQSTYRLTKLNSRARRPCGTHRRPQGSTCRVTAFRIAVPDKISSQYPFRITHFSSLGVAVTIWEYGFLPLFSRHRLHGLECDIRSLALLAGNIFDHQALEEASRARSSPQASIRFRYEMRSNHSQRRSTQKMKTDRGPV